MTVYQFWDHFRTCLDVYGSFQDIIFDKKSTKKIMSIVPCPVLGHSDNVWEILERLWEISGQVLGQKKKKKKKPESSLEVITFVPDRTKPTNRMWYVCVTCGHVRLFLGHILGHLEHFWSSICIWPWMPKIKSTCVVSHKRTLKHSSSLYNLSHV